MRPFELLLVSAETPADVDARAAKLASFLEQTPAASLQDVCFSLAKKRPLPARRVLIASGRDDAIALLRKADPKRTANAVAKDGARRVAFLLPGPGEEVQTIGELAAAEAALGEQHAACEALVARVGLSAKADGWEAANAALFSSEYALAQLWMSWGVRPSALLGYSFGELVAATLAGVFEPAEGVRLAIERGRLFDRVPAGAMISVALPQEEARKHLTPDLEIAGIRSDRACVVSGPTSSIVDIEARLAAAGINYTRLAVKTGGHSPLVDPFMDEFANIVAGTPRHPLRIPVVSNVSGEWLGEAEAANPAYWAQQLRRTVQFAHGVKTLVSTCDVILEIGGVYLTSLVAGQLPKGAGIQALPSLSVRAGTTQHQALLLTLARLWTIGVEIDWDVFYRGDARGLIELPSS